MTLVVLFISTVATLALWIRPPNVMFGGVVFPSTSNKVDLESDGFKINLELNITVNNPNFFSATFENISALATYPVGNISSMGGGSLSNVKFPSHAITPILFPFVINYQLSQDPSLVVAKDIASKCGFDGSTPQNIVVNYVLTLRIRVLAIISPRFRGSASFPCPLQESDLSGIIAGLV